MIKINLLPTEKRKAERTPLPRFLLIAATAAAFFILLFYNLLKALPADCHLLMVGDIDQLPSVGSGDVLRHLIASGICPVTHLQTIFRQSEDSLIIENAHLINQGRMPVLSNHASDFFLFTVEDPDAGRHDRVRRNRVGRG